MSTHKAYYRLPTNEVLKQLKSERLGLSAKESRKRLADYGFNILQPVNKESVIHKYFRQYKDLMILLLIGTALISFFTGEDKTAIAILVLVIFNTAIGFSQEYKAEKLMESLERLVVHEAKVMREGDLQEISAAELVPGDIVYFEEGDSIPADLRLIDETGLATNDFALTGESNPSRKFTHAISADVELANRHNLVFTGTTVATGKGFGIVINTGMRTELGRIAGLSSDTRNDISPLQKEMNNIATRVTQGVVILCAILMPIAMKFGLPFHGALLLAIGIASSIVPQGLPAEINTSLAQAAKKLAKAHALVKKLSAVESLGATSIICTDKTGTLTKNEMTVQELYISKRKYHVSGTGYEHNGTIQSENGSSLSSEQLSTLKPFFITGAYASNASVNPPDDEHATWHVIGDPTEGALITLARKAGIDTDAISAESPELREFAFDSGRKRMSSFREINGKLYMFVKGAPESVLTRSTRMWSGGKTHSLSENDIVDIKHQNTLWAKQAMRNLAFAYRTFPAHTDIKSLDMDEAEQNLVFLGMVSMVDPLRDEVHEAMSEAHNAHIRVSIVTGDFATTAKAVAAKAGLATKAHDITVITGEELRKLDDSRVLHLVSAGSVIFSRVSPEDKLRIVGLVKDSGKVVAVTGDGINDAPALKRADIGVAMGKTGTDVAQQSSDIVLLDDSFKTLVGAVQQGRIIFENIRKGTLSCFTSNSAELVVTIISLGAFILFQVPFALSVMQLLAIDMIAELFPIAALGWDKADKNVMKEKPRDPHNHILNKSAIIDLLWSGLLIGGIAFANFLLFFGRHGVPATGANLTDPELYIQATAMTYLTIVICQLLNILQRRSQNGLFTKYQLHNRLLWTAIGFSLTFVIAIIYSPVLQPYFGTGSVSFIDWLFVLLGAGIFVGAQELKRYANKHHTRDHIIKLYHQNESKA